MLSKPQLPLQLLRDCRQKVPALLALPRRDLLALLLLLLLLQHQLPASLPLQQRLLYRLAKAQHAAEGRSHLQSPEGDVGSEMGESCCHLFSAVLRLHPFVEASKGPWPA